MATPTALVSAIDQRGAGEPQRGAPPADPYSGDDERFPVEPLEAFLSPTWAAEARERGMDDVEVGTLLRSLNRARTNGGLTTRAADRLAVRAAGVHPSLIWGRQWWATATCGGPGVCSAADCCEPGTTRDGDEVCD